jgi:LPXTG-motif cell wall-anchored protein
VTTEQTPADPRIAMLGTRVQVDEMAVAAPATPSESSVQVESAGVDGDRPVHTAQVPSADYDPPQRPAERLPKTGTPLLQIAVFGAGLLATGLVFGMLRHRR